LEKIDNWKKINFLDQTTIYLSLGLHKKAAWRIRDAYPGSRILIFTHPGSRILDPGSRIPDPKTATKERGEKKIVVIPFYVATNFTKL
jgi:hypothetical protein